MGEIEKDGAIKQREYIINDLDDCITIVYASGSTGLFKGAVISGNVFRATFPIRRLSRSDECV